MPDEPENHSLRLLQEMRAKMDEIHADLTARIDGNTIILNLLAGILHSHEERITDLEVKTK